MDAELRRAITGTRRRIEILKAQLAKLRAAGSVLSKTLYGRKREQQDRPRSERKRREEHNPPPDTCVCEQCGQPYAPNHTRRKPLLAFRSQPSWTVHRQKIADR